MYLVLISNFGISLAIKPHMTHITCLYKFSTQNYILFKLPALIYPFGILKISQVFSPDSLIKYILVTELPNGMLKTLRDT